MLIKNILVVLLSKIVFIIFKKDLFVCQNWFSSLFITYSLTLTTVLNSSEECNIYASEARIILWYQCKIDIFPFTYYGTVILYLFAIEYITQKGITVPVLTSKLTNSCTLHYYSRVPPCGHSSYVDTPL